MIITEDKVGKQLLFELLHLDRSMEKLALEFRLVFLAGYRAALVRHKEDIVYYISERVRNNK